MQWVSMHFEARKKIQETTVEGKKKPQKQLFLLSKIEEPWLGTTELNFKHNCWTTIGHKL